MEATMAAPAASANRSAMIAYGTETGNAQDAAEEVARLCERLHFKTHLLELDLVSLVRV
jgi:flavodoxin